MENIFNPTDKHLKCLGNGVDGCDYDTIIDCDDCKYNNSKFPGRKNPKARINRAK